MILNFKTKFKDGSPTNFDFKILREEKPHSIREDPFNRWRIGRLIHFSIGARTKKYFCFKKGYVRSTQKFEIKWHKATKKIPTRTWDIFVDGKDLDIHDCFDMAINDGFDSLADFLEWFNKNFKGKIIHWTDLKY